MQQDSVTYLHVKQSRGRMRPNCRGSSVVIPSFNKINAKQHEQHKHQQQQPRHNLLYQAQNSCRLTVIHCLVLVIPVCLLAICALSTSLVEAQDTYNQQQQQQQHWNQQLVQPSQGGLMTSGSSNINTAIGLQSSSQSAASMFKDLSGPISGKIQTLDVICGKNFMTVRAEFSGPFYGIVFSKGTYGQENCIYVKPNSGLTHAAFNVYYDQCGTKPDLQGKFYENTVVIQYGSDIIEAYDEAKRLRCEWFEAYEKPATFKPAIPVADLEVVEMNFQGDDIDCWMEIQEGTGPMSREVSKIVPVGQPMTIVVAINDYNGQFDMRVKSCVAHDGVQQPIALTDEFGCVLRPKMLTPFQKIRNPGGIHKKATILSYSRFLAFKFPDSMTVQIQCTVEVCRHGCADACQRVPSIAATTLQPELSLTAKWPSNSNQAAISGPSIATPIDGPNRYPGLATRVQFNNGPVPSSMGSIGADEHNFRPQFKAPADGGDSSQAAPSPNAPSPADDMSGSESNQQPSVASKASFNQQQQPLALKQSVGAANHQYRRSQSDNELANAASAQFDGRVPQYLVPRRNQPLHGARLPSSTSTTSSTTPATTSSTTSSTTTTSPPMAEQDSGADLVRTGAESGLPSGANSDQASTGLGNNADDQLTRLVASDSASQQQSQQGTNNNRASTGNSQLPADANNQQSSAASQAQGSEQPSEQSNEHLADSQRQQTPDTKADESQSRPQVASIDERTSDTSNNHNQDPSLPATIELDNNGQQQQQRPSVQGTDEADQMKPEASEPQPSDVSPSQQQQQQQSGKDSALGTVEVEIPANEDPVRAFLASNGAQQRPSSSSSSVGQQQDPTSAFNSVRFGSNSPIDLVDQTDSASSSSGSGEQITFESSPVYESSRNDAAANQQQQQQSAPSSSGEQQQSTSGAEPANHKRDGHRNDDDTANLEAVSQLLGSGKIKFGARSQPPVQHHQNQQASGIESSLSSTGNHHQIDHAVAAAPDAPQAPVSDTSNANSDNMSAQDHSVMIDRSDDSPVIMTGDIPASQVQANRRSDAALIDAVSGSGAGSHSAPEESLTADESSPVANKHQILPVVGTDELATGPIQLEDRMGAAPSAQTESLEQALNRLQHQIPQVAALTGSVETSSSSSSSSSQAQQAPEAMTGSQQQQASPAASEATNQQQQAAVDSANDRSDRTSNQQAAAVSSLLRNKPTQQQQIVQHLQAQHKLAPGQQQQAIRSQVPAGQELSQPHPNVVGQAKVMPDPSAIAGHTTSSSPQGARGSGSSSGMLAQASSLDLGETKILPQAPSGSVSPPQQLQQQMQLQQQQQQQLGQGKPVAQITNIPMGLGFAPSQMAEFNQLSQQLAQFQQQAAIKQQQQQPPLVATQTILPATTTTTTTTSKPPLRSRFNLLNPQAALRTVASRFLPKSAAASSQQQQQQQQQQLASNRLPSIAQQFPQLLNNIKSLPVEQQQKLLASAMQQQQQQQQQAAGFLARPQIPTQQYYNNFVNGFQQQQQQQQQAVRQPAGGLFSRLSGGGGNHGSAESLINNQQQQQLVRSRRSALLPSGKRGSGEVGVQKTFMVVTGMDLAFTPDLNDSKLPQTIDGRRGFVATGDGELDEVVYGICMPVMSLTFVLTCAFWLVVFLLVFCIYMLTKTRRHQRDAMASKLSDVK